ACASSAYLLSLHDALPILNLLASTLIKGASASLASRRAISVFPTPVGPSRRMLLGNISSRISLSAFIRRQPFRRAMATDRLASRSVEHTSELQSRFYLVCL